MKKESGFSLMELMIAIAIIAILAVTVIPRFVDWRNRSRIQGFANNLAADLELAKMRAIKENNDVAIVFVAPDYDRYQVFVDSVVNNGTIDAGETVIRDVQFPEGLVYDPGASGFAGGVHGMRFNGRGLPNSFGGGTATLVQGGETRAVVVNAVGRIQLQ